MSATAPHATLAIHGGTPVRTAPFGGWPQWGEEEERALLAALRSGHWGSLDGTYVTELEQAFAALQGARVRARGACHAPCNLLRRLRLTRRSAPPQDPLAP